MYNSGAYTRIYYNYYTCILYYIYIYVRLGTPESGGHLHNTIYTYKILCQRRVFIRAREHNIIIIYTTAEPRYWYIWVMRTYIYIMICVIPTTAMRCLHRGRSYVNSSPPPPPPHQPRSKIPPVEKPKVKTPSGGYRVCVCVCVYFFVYL